MIGIDPAMFELFRIEARAHAETLARGLLELEADPGNAHRIEPLMRAAHSLKGAARIVGIEPAVQLAHVMEDALVAAQAGKVQFTTTDIDTLLKASDVLAALSDLADSGAIPDWIVAHEPAVAALEPVLRDITEGRTPQPVTLPERVEQSNLHVEPTKNPHVEPVVEPEKGTRGGQLPPPPPHESATIPAEPFALADGYSMFDLFREEVRACLTVMHSLDVGKGIPEPAFEALRQLRGAARLMKCRAIEDAINALGQFLQAIHGRRIAGDSIARDWVQYAIAVLAGLLETDDETFPKWLRDGTPALDQIRSTLLLAVEKSPAIARPPSAAASETYSPKAVTPTPAQVASTPALPIGEAVVRVTAQSLNRLMGLAGESLVQARWLLHFSDELVSFKKQHDLLSDSLDLAFQAAATARPIEQVAQLVADARRQAGVCRHDLTDQTSEFDDHAARAEDLNTRLYREVIASRMRPFADVLHALPRVVRDMARSLGKQARLVVEGDQTDVDRDILEKLEAPLNHLIRNAVDHGLETTQLRVGSGKPEMGTVRVRASHRAGLLSVIVSDDGRGIHLDRLRQKIVERGLNAAELVGRMTEAELLEFLFLPGFTTSTQVTEYSGRGVGLDVVQDTVRRVGGSVRITTKAGEGTTFHLQLPITLSVIRAVVVDIGNEPYAFPHTRIDRLLRVPRSNVRSLEHRQFITVDGQNVGLVVASQLLDLPSDGPRGEELPVLLLSDQSGPYGLIVDAFRAEQDLVVRPLDARLGKVPNVSAAAILDNGDPVLIVDVEDMVRSMDQFIQTGSLRRLESRASGPARKKRVLVVDDSITVREVERQLLAHKGYEVAVAVDGMDGWNQVRSSRFDLVVTDVDMPRMNGIQLVQAVRADDRLKELPVVIVSYKEREEDRARGLEVGANSYLTKSSFHDNRFVEAVADLIGPA